MFVILRRYNTIKNDGVHALFFIIPVCHTCCTACNNYYNDYMKCTIIIYFREYILRFPAGNIIYLIMVGFCKLYLECGHFYD